MIKGIRARSTRNPTQRSPEQAVQGWVWTGSSDIPLDRGGPVTVPFDPPPADFAERPIFALFEQIVAQRADAVALRDGTAKLTFGQVRAAARGLARRIAAEVPTGKAVAILLPNTPASVIAALACFGAGRCCLVLNADHPVERNAAILRDAGAHAVIVAADYAPEALPIPEGVVRIAPESIADATLEASRWVPNPIGPDDPAIVLYTSGSTGRPKGIVLSQATILDRARKRILAMHLHREDRFLSLGALGSTAGLIASLAVLLCGGEQFILSVSAAGVSSLLSLIRDERITVLQGVTALLRLLFEADGATESLVSLRLVRTAGERLLRKDLDAWRAVLPATCDFAVGYGQTEISVSAWSVPREYEGNERLVPVGYLAPDLEFAIVGEDGRHVRQGEVGELLIRSRYVALGEWESGRCVRGRTLPDPVDARIRILPTGDLVRIGLDGILHIVSRRDRQVKVHGQRVEPAEIEDVLRRVSGVADVAIGVRRSGEKTTLLGFVVARNPDDALLLDRVRQSVGQALPSYMQPARILQIERLPLLPGGKVDETALLAIEAATPRQRRKAGPVATATPRAWRAVEHAWLRILDRTSLDADVPFDEAGGDSLGLLRFIFHLEQQCGIALPLDTFYAELRPSAFAERLDRCLKEPAPTRSEVGRPLFLLPGVGKDEPRLVRFRANCAPALRMIPIEYGDWPDWIAPGFDLDALVARIVAVIEAEAPDGPIFLCGYSLGGKIAYAVAIALSALGRTIGFLGILDTDISQGAAKPKPGISKRFADVVRRGLAERLAWYVSWPLTNPPRPSQLRLAALFYRARMPGDFGFYLHHYTRSRVLLRLVKAGWAQIARLQPQPRVSAVLFRSMERPADAPDDLGWNEICPNVTVVAVGGDHYTMLDSPNLEALSARFMASALEPSELSPAHSRSFGERD
jgi:amino acid adenylation domain-containing protein